jgi:hypothetical protein
MSDSQTTTREPAHGHSHAPAREGGADVEPREETIAKAVEESRAANVDQRVPADTTVDPSTRRGMNKALLRAATVGFLIGAAVGAGIGALLRVAPAALGDVGELPGIIAVMAFLGGVIGIIIASYMVLEREDGRVEEEVEKDLGDQPPPG